MGFQCGLRFGLGFLSDRIAVCNPGFGLWLFSSLGLLGVQIIGMHHHARLFEIVIVTN